MGENPKVLIASPVYWGMKYCISETPHSKLLPTSKSVYGRSGASESKKHYYLLQPLILIEHKIITFVKIFYFSYCNPALLYPHSKLWGIKEE